MEGVCKYFVNKTETPSFFAVLDVYKRQASSFLLVTISAYTVLPFSSVTGSLLFSVTVS